MHLLPDVHNLDTSTVQHALPMAPADLRAPHHRELLDTLPNYSDSQRINICRGVHQLPVALLAEAVQHSR